MAQFLFITDLDNTLVGDDEALATLNAHLSQHREEYGTLIIYSSGRSPILYQELRTEYDLLEPDFLVLSVGTEIYQRGSDQPDPEWQYYLSTGWDREQVLAIASHFSDLIPQPPSEQTDFKVSYFLDGSIANEVMPRLEKALRDNGLDVQFIYSSNKDFDILPKNGNKGAAVAFLQQKMRMNGDRTVVCGDSGNDLSMFQQTQAKGIIVGNAKSELRDWHQTQASEDTYLARARCAGGILEGLHHFEFLPLPSGFRP
ncbi:MAG: sucrose-phosphate phosphatase [Leptolyngbyaceae bacterium]|nr:sucrose-phosphate phosphatase [Leptolyngbyaceae bacterium]